ncbi:hypothetical protein IEQ34_007588 [Dendrobium chrysotoxum]|uniref:Uncharacterized protein n=1 Tax=Dendrobium chrysotoxum TaxID=161865 RepID=A0AAV7H1N8_DENCH|nr:hypothetical protein IEQ34_007588 [Dendrobium chrysotoxum]
MSIVMGLIVLFKDRRVNAWNLQEKWGKLKELPIPLHIGAEDLLRILKLPDLDALHYEPEIGSSSSTPVVSKASKNKRKNYLRRVRKKVVKARKTAEAKALKHVNSKANKKFVAPSTYPLHGGNCFHSALVTQRREVVETRA